MFFKKVIIFIIAVAYLVMALPLAAKADGWFLLGVISRLATMPLPKLKKENSELGKMIMHVEQSYADQSPGEVLKIENFYDMAELNEIFFTITFYCSVVKSQKTFKTLISLCFEKKNTTTTLFGIVMWDDVKEYNDNLAAPQMHRENIKKLTKVDVGEITFRSQSTVTPAPTPANPPASQAPAPVTPVAENKPAQTESKQ